MMSDIDQFKQGEIVVTLMTSQLIAGNEEELQRHGLAMTVACDRFSVSRSANINRR